MEAGCICGVSHANLLAIFAGKEVFALDAVHIALSFHLDPIADRDLMLELPSSIQVLAVLRLQKLRLQILLTAAGQNDEKGKDKALKLRGG